jgi:2-octaprenyl-6-methoxyphenol hydroxylase
MAPQEARRVAALEPSAFLSELQQRFGWRAGRFVRTGRSTLYPLELTRALGTIAPRMVFIGNAAQSLHPVAGQGFNLGLRDAAMLAELLAGAEPDPGSAHLLERFAAWRAGDRSAVIRFTDGLVRLFGSRIPGVGLARDLGLLLFDVTPAAKSALARVSVGFSGPTPRLARGLALR